MGSSGGGSSKQTVTQSNLPEYARPYFERLMGRAEASSNEPYYRYPGQRVEGLNTLQNTAIGNIAGQPRNATAANASMYGTSAAGGLLSNGTFQAGNIGSRYQATGVSPTGYQAPRMFDAPDRVMSTFNAGEFDRRAADKYMSPYQQKVVDARKREATRQFDIDSTGRDMQAAKAGAFGGSRAALVQAEAARNHARQLDDIQADGDQKAFENAQAQFERDRQSRYNASQMGLGAQQFNSQQQMAYGQTGLQNLQRAGELNLQDRQKAAELSLMDRQKAAEMNLQGQIANEQARAAAAGVRNQSYAGAGQMAGTLANIGKTQQDMDFQRYLAQLQAGDKMQQTNQMALDAAYDDFVNQRDYDKQQLNFLSGVLRGVPVTANSDVRFKEASNPLSQVAGLGIAGLGAYNAMNGG